MIKRYIAALLMVFLVVSINAKDDKKVIELKEIEQEFDDLSKKIIEKEKLINEIDKRIKELIFPFIENKKRELKLQSPGKEFTNEEIGESLNHDVLQFIAGVVEYREKEKSNKKASFIVDNKSFDKDTSVLKFYLILWGLEVGTLKEYFEKWENLIIEMATLRIENTAQQISNKK